MMIRRIVERVPCPTCGANVGSFCIVHSKHKSVFRYRTRAYVHAARKETFRKLIIDETDGCFGKFYVVGNTLCDEKCDDRTDCKLICSGALTYEDRYRRGNTTPKPKSFPLVEILSSMFREGWDSSVQAVPGRLRGE